MYHYNSYYFRTFLLFFYDSYIVTSQYIVVAVSGTILHRLFPTHRSVFVFSLFSVSNIIVYFPLTVDYFDLLY